MPAHFVDDGWHSGANGPRSNLFLDYATVADSIGVYTTNDYADIVDHLVGGAAERAVRTHAVGKRGARVRTCACSALVSWCKS